MTLEARGESGGKLAQLVRDDIHPRWLEGGLALVCSSGKVGVTPAPEPDIRQADMRPKPGTRRQGDSGRGPHFRSHPVHHAYRVSYILDGLRYHYGGIIRKDPQAKPEIVTAAFTCTNGLGFPHAGMVRHVSWFKPDFLAFTGDQIYERIGE